MKGLGAFLITIALSVGLVSCVYPPPFPEQYNLTISSTEGGSVTTPGEGTFTYWDMDVVELVAEADEGYQFVEWTGDVRTIGDVNAANTTITVSDDYSITANFEVTTPIYGTYSRVHVVIQGPEEVVFDWTTDQCDMEDIPDMPARAFRDADGKVQLIATHYSGRRMIGDDLNSVTRDCRVIMSSDKDPDPSKYNDREWLASLYTLDGETIYALIHNEYQGHQHPGMSITGDYLKNWYNSITYAKSDDKGESYSHAAAPGHLVASLPYRYVPEEGPSGIALGSNIIHNPEDDYYYVLLHVFQETTQISDVSIMRTRTLNDPQSWRAWNGTEFAIAFVNPYTDTPDDPAQYVPQPVVATGGSLTFNTYLGKYIVVGAGMMYDFRDQTLREGFVFALSDDLIHWSPPELIMEVRLPYPSRPWTDERLAYPSLIDPGDASRNFEMTGQEPYLYYTRFHPCTEENWCLNRDLVRAPIRFIEETNITAWEFDRPGDDEGWIPVNQLSYFTISGGILKASSCGTDPFMRLDDVLNLEANKYNIVEIRMRVSDGNCAGLYFATVDDGQWGEETAIHFAIAPSSQFQTYKIDMASRSTWSGKISQIRLDPTDAEADIEIDYIRIYTENT